MKTYAMEEVSYMHYISNNEIYRKINRVPKNMKFLEKKKFQADYIFYLDQEMLKADIGQAERNIGWLTESRAISPASHDLLEVHVDEMAPMFKFIFTNDKSLTKLNEKIKWIPGNPTWIRVPKVYQHKVNLVSMVTSAKNYCPGHSRRREVIRQYEGKIHLFGRGFNEIEFKEDGLATYMFSIAHENASYDGYFTEKVLDCFATGTIPIYWGDPTISETFNPDGIITLDEKFNIESLTPDLYYSKMDAIRENCQIVKDRFMTVEDYMYDNYLKDNDGHI